MINRAGTDDLVRVVGSVYYVAQKEVDLPWPGTRGGLLFATPAADRSWSGRCTGPWVRQHPRFFYVTFIISSLCPGNNPHSRTRPSARSPAIENRKTRTYDRNSNGDGKGGRLASGKEVMPVDVYQALSLMIAFATLVVLIMSHERK